MSNLTRESKHMSNHTPKLGIDFGTSFSSMSWVADPETGRAEIILNAEGALKTPSVVYYGSTEVLVGTPASVEFSNRMALSNETERVLAAPRYICSIKRNLLRPPVIALPDGRIVRPQEVAAEILRKLKRDAETGHFHQLVRQATLTVPAAFDSVQRTVIESAAKLAGFDEVELLDEPVAAAIAFSREGQRVGNTVLVYDLGGGTCDLAVLSKQADGRFESVMTPAGDASFGGDDLDQLLYEHCEKQGITPSRDHIDQAFLKLCRRAKEQLSFASTATIRHIASGSSKVLDITRAVFESLIRERIDHSLRQVSTMMQQAKSSSAPIDTVVLVGGSARIPLVADGLTRCMKENHIAGEPLHFNKQDVAVALGASYASLSKIAPPDVEPSRIIKELDTWLMSRSIQTPTHESGEANRNDIIDGLDRLI